MRLKKKPLHLITDFNLLFPFSPSKNLKVLVSWAGEMAQKFRTLLEDPHGRLKLCVTAVLGCGTALSLRAPGMYMVTQTHTQAETRHLIFKKKNFEK